MTIAATDSYIGPTKLTRRGRNSFKRILRFKQSQNLTNNFFFLYKVKNTEWIHEVEGK